METKTFFEVSAVLYIPDTDTGKVSKIKRTYLVESDTVTESEAIVAKDLAKEGVNDYEINQSKLSKICKVIERNE